MKGKFIVFEGVDGCGKGTQLKLVASYLFDKNKEYDLFLTREPTRDYKEIRERMGNSDDVRKDVEWYAGMFVEDRINHLRKYIMPMLNAGTHVLSDRYKYSTLAYQWTQGMDFEKLVEMHLGLLVPDLTMIFDCPADVAFTRRKKDNATDMFDKDLKFQIKLRENYLKLKDKFPKENIQIINANYLIDDVFNEVRGYINEIL